MKIIIYVVFQMYHFLKTFKSSTSSLPPSLPLLSRDELHCKAAKPCICVMAFLVLYFFLTCMFCFVAGLTYPKLIPGRLSTRTEVSILQSSLETCLNPKLQSSISGYPKTLSGDVYHHHYFNNYTQMLFTFLSPSRVHSGVCQRLPHMRYHHRLDAESDMRIQVSSSRSDSRGICKNVKQCH